MRGSAAHRPNRRRFVVRIGLVSMVVAVISLVLGLGMSAAAPSSVPSNVPYALDAPLPSTASSPSVDAAAPYTPAVLSLIAQIEPSNPPTQAQLANASALLHDGPNATCHNVGPVSAPTGTTPSITPICWTDAQGVLNTSGTNARGSTGPTTLMALGSTFDRQARQRVGSDGGHRGAGVHGDGHVRAADRPRPTAELGPQPDHNGRGSVPEQPDGRRRRSTASRAPGRCRR